MVSTSNGLPTAFGGDALGGRARIGGSDDRPSDYEVRSAGGERLGGAQRAALIASCIAGPANAGGHDVEVRTALPAYRRDLLRRGDHSVETSGLGQRGQRSD